MVSTENLKTLDHETEIYTPMHRYGNALGYIFEKNHITAKIAKTNRKFENENDEKIRIYWAKRFEEAGNHRFISPRIMLRIRTHFDPDELFDFLMKAMTEDEDIKKYLSYFESSSHTPDPNILE